MIYFNDSAVAKTLEIIKAAHDCANVLCDLSQIEQAKANVNLCGGVSVARQLDKKLRKKYPCIDTMINFANTMLSQVSQSKKTYSPNEAAVSNLIQDYLWYSLRYGGEKRNCARNEAIYQICRLRRLQTFSYKVLYQFRYLLIWTQKGTVYKGCTI